MPLPIWLNPDSTVVEKPTHYPCIEGTNHAISTLGEKFSKQCEQCHHIRHFTSFTKNSCGFGPSAEQWHLHPKIKGLNPATGIGREKMAKKNILDNVTFHYKIEVNLCLDQYG